jgi:hypothetical protein
MKCPSCGSEDISKVVYKHTINDTEKSSGDVFWSVVGFWLFGWVGVLLGLDETEETTTRKYKKEGFVCNNCKAKLKNKSTKWKLT